jgi:hypothetical protein
MNSAAIEVIRHSLNAASAALSLLDTRPVVEKIIVEEVVEEVVVDNAPVPNLDEELFYKLMGELDGEYKLRTISELTAKLGISHSKMLQLLAINDVDHVTKIRRSDNAPLIGLGSRN